MRERAKWAERMNILLERNFKAAKYYRRTGGIVTDILLEHYFLNQASQRYRFALELSREVKNLGGFPTSFINYPNQLSFENRPMHKLTFNPAKTIKICRKTDKSCLMEYKKALSEINDGFLREILLRHKSQIESTIKELKGIKTRTTGVIKPERNINKPNKTNSYEIY